MNEAEPLSGDVETPELRAAVREAAEDQLFDMAAVESTVDATSGRRERLAREAGDIRDRLAGQLTALRTAIGNAIAERERLEREASAQRERLDATRGEIARTEAALAAARAQRDKLEREATAQSKRIDASTPALNAAEAQLQAARQRRERLGHESNERRAQNAREVARIEVVLQGAFTDRARLDQMAADVRERLDRGDGQLGQVDVARSRAEAELERLRRVDSELARVDAMRATQRSGVTGAESDPTRIAARAAAAEYERARQDATAIRAATEGDIGRLEGAIRNATIQQELLERRATEGREHLDVTTRELVEANALIVRAISERATATQHAAADETRIGQDLAKVDAALAAAGGEVARARDGLARERERREGLHASIDRIDATITSAIQDRDRLAAEHGAARERVEAVAADIIEVEAAIRHAAAEQEQLQQLGREMAHVSGAAPEPIVEAVPDLPAASPSTDSGWDGSVVPSAGTIPSAPAALTDATPQATEPAPGSRTSEPESSADHDFRAFVGSFRQQLRAAPAAAEDADVGPDHTATLLMGLAFVVAGIALIAFVLGFLTLGPAAIVAAAALLFAFVVFLRTR